MASYRTESTERLFEMIANLHTKEECCALFEDLCTIREIQSMAQRFDTAILLSQGLRYQEIAEKVGISTATISRVSQCLLYGAGGYQTAIDRMAETEIIKE